MIDTERRWLTRRSGIERVVRNVVNWRTIRAGVKAQIELVARADREATLQGLKGHKATEGFLAETPEGWNDELECLMDGHILRWMKQMALRGKARGHTGGLSTNTTGVDGASNQFSANRAFIQWAGFTFGRAQSFFDFYSQAALGYLGFTPNSDTGDGGWEVFGYTAQFGNGFSGTISAETRRSTLIMGQGTTTNSGIPVVVNGLAVPDLFNSVAAQTGTGSINGAAANFAANGYGGRCRMSSATCALTRLGVLPRSAALCIRSM
jgi:hypothetical protein